jgi:hypothetical protein
VAPGRAPGAGEVYSEARARLLRISIRVVQVLAGTMVAIAAWFLVVSLRDEGEARTAGILFVMVLVVQAAVLATMTVWTLRRLPLRSRDARTWCLSTACLTLLASIPLLTIPFGIVVVFVGIFLLTLALRTDPLPA